MNPTTGNPDAAAEAAIDQALGQHGIRLVDAGQNGSGEQIQNTVDMTGMEGVQVIADPASHFSEPEPQPQQPQQAPQQQARPSRASSRSRSPSPTSRRSWARITPRRLPSSPRDRMRRCTRPRGSRA